MSTALGRLGASVTRDDLRRHTPALGDVLTRGGRTLRPDGTLDAGADPCSDI